MHVEVEATWGIYRRMIAAYRDPDRARGRETMRAVISSISTRVPAALREVCRLGRTLTKRAADVLAYFDRPGTSNGGLTPFRRSGGSESRPVARGFGQGELSDHVEQ